MAKTSKLIDERVVKKDIENYFQECITNKKAITAHGLANTLGIKLKQLKQIVELDTHNNQMKESSRKDNSQGYIQSNESKEEKEDWIGRIKLPTLILIQKAFGSILQAYEENLSKGGGVAVGSMFALKSLAEWRDTPINTSDKSISINLISYNNTPPKALNIPITVPAIITDTPKELTENNTVPDTKIPQNRGDRIPKARAKLPV